MGSLVQLLLGSDKGDSHNVASYFQNSIIVFIFGVSTVLSSFPIVHRAFIECVSDSGHIYKDVLETKCLAGNLHSNITWQGKVSKVAHLSYQEMPYLLFLCTLLNLVPKAITHGLCSSAFKKVTQHMRHFCAAEDDERARRLLKYFKYELQDMSQTFFIFLIAGVLGILSICCQIFFWDVKLNGVLSNIFTKGGSSFEQFFPQEAHCTVTVTAPGGELDTEVFVCYLTMNRLYGLLFKFIVPGYIIGLTLHVFCTANHLFLLFSKTRRYRYYTYSCAYYKVIIYGIFCFFRVKIGRLLKHHKSIIAKKIHRRINAPEFFFLQMLRDAVCESTFDIFILKLCGRQENALDSLV